MAADPIKIFNRHTGRIETEEIYGESWLRWAYGTSSGRMAIWAVGKRFWFSRWYGRRMKVASSRKRVLPFIGKYRIDKTEFVIRPEDFLSFNDFFIRTLRPETRPVDPDPDVAVFTADGRHLGLQDISQAKGFFVKGQVLDLASLLGNIDLARRYANGAIVLSRLCPVDCHRFHFPAAGMPDEPHLLNGVLYSVNPVALRQNISFLQQNKRMLTTLETDRFGLVLILEVGATCVGSIVQTYSSADRVDKGVEKGFFQFGGSACLTIFQKGRIRLADDLLEHSADGREVYARMGERMGVASG